MSNQSENFIKHGRSWFSILAILACFSSSGTASEERNLFHAGTERQYWIHSPERDVINSPLPLIVALHGALMNGKQMETLTRLSELSNETKKFAVVYPSADPKGNGGIWDFLSPRIESPDKVSRITAGRDDLGFLSRLIESLISEGLADERRIYLTGISNGAFFANRFVMEEPETIAAMGLVAGTLPTLFAKQEKAERPLPLLYIHGTADEVVKIDGSSFLTSLKLSLSANQYCQWWAKRNGLTNLFPTSEMLPERDLSDGCRVERLTWPSPDAPVIFYRLIGGGHTWPGGPDTQPTRLLGPISMEFDTSNLLWDFFRSHRIE